MTLKTFIELLSDFPEDTEVVFDDDKGYSIKYVETIADNPSKKLATFSSTEHIPKRKLIITTY